MEINEIKTLHPLEIKTILNYKNGDKISSKKLQDDLKFNTGQANQVINWLSYKGILINKTEEVLVTYEGTPHVIYLFKHGLIEFEIIKLIKESNNLSLENLKKNLQNLIKERYSQINDENKSDNLEFKKIYDEEVNRNFTREITGKINSAIGTLMKHKIIKKNENNELTILKDEIPTELKQIKRFIFMSYFNFEELENIKKEVNEFKDFFSILISELEKLSRKEIIENWEQIVDNLKSKFKCIKFREKKLFNDYLKVSDEKIKTAIRYLTNDFNKILKAKKILDQIKINPNDINEHKILKSIPDLMFTDIIKKYFSYDFNSLFKVIKKIDLHYPIYKNKLSESEVNIIESISKKKSASSLFKINTETIINYNFSSKLIDIQNEIKKLKITGNELGNLTASMLKDKSYKGKSFRGYSVDVPTKKIIIGKANPYCQFLETVKDKLVALGFTEFDSNIVSTEFWNSDALFMPQFHSSRDIHDVYRIKNPSSIKELEQPFLDRVAKVHENGDKTGSRGWNYKFDKNFTKRLVLRSQGTAVSAETLKFAKTPSKYFGILRCFRVDQVDATHLSDFYQTEGIVVSKDVNLKSLLGYLEIFAKEIAGASDIKYVPGYFPFTEPSVEIHIKHPVLGWFELGGAGIFRPEVCKPQGINSPVLAWGLGIDRMALMHLGLSDLRDLFSKDIESVRNRKVFIQ